MKIQIADFESLYLYAGIHIMVDGLYRMFSKRFPYAVYYEGRNHEYRIHSAIVPTISLT